MKDLSKRKIVIVGGGGHARVLLDILRLRKQVITGYTDVKVRAPMPLKYLGDDAAFIKKHSPREVVLVNGIGSVGLPQARREVYERFKKAGFVFLSVIHPRAVIASDAVLGEGVQAMAGTVVNTGARAGENVIINTLSSVDHDSNIGAHTHIAPGVTVCADVHIGEGCHAGTGAKFIQGLRIGDGVLICAGAVVVKDIASHQQAAGVPARVRKT